MLMDEILRFMFIYCNNIYCKTVITMENIHISCPVLSFFNNLIFFSIHLKIFIILLFFIDKIKYQYYFLLPHFVYFSDFYSFLI